MTETETAQHNESIRHEQYERSHEYYDRYCKGCGEVWPCQGVLLTQRDALLEALEACYTVLAEGSYHNAPCVEQAQAAIDAVRSEEEGR